MKERQRWRPEEDSLLRAYVKQYGPRDWHLLPQRTNKPLDRDPKSCLERWKNYLKPGIKKGSLTEHEQRLVIKLQSEYGNKWKKIASQVPGRTAKRLGKWWEVFKEKQLKEEKSNNKKNRDPIEEGKYDHILETFAEKIVRERAPRGVTIRMAPPGPTNALPPWLANSTVPSPSVTLTLSPSAGPPNWSQVDRYSENTPNGVGNLPSLGVGIETGPMLNEIVECCRELEEGHRLWAAHRSEAAWRLKRVELQLESEKACRRREKVEEIEERVKALREEQKACLDSIEAEYREQLAGLRREAEIKEQKLADQWAAKHLRLTKFLEQMGCRSLGGEHSGR